MKCSSGFKDSVLNSLSLSQEFQMKGEIWREGRGQERREQGEERRGEAKRRLNLGLWKADPERKGRQGIGEAKESKRETGRLQEEGIRR